MLAWDNLVVDWLLDNATSVLVVIKLVNDNFVVD